MDSKEVLQQFLVGAMRASNAITELEKIILNKTKENQRQEVGRARYVIGFIRRVSQYNSGKASNFDMCLNIRDLILVLGRIRLTDKLYQLVHENGADFGLVCEDGLQVSCLLQTPSWLHPDKYVKDVYSLKCDETFEDDASSAGDLILKQNTIFNTYKSFEQKLAVHTALCVPHGFTLLISQPTGGGKSLVTQVLAATTNGLTIVIVPTVALAMDQFYSAKKNLLDCEGIFCYRGEQSENERLVIIKAIREQKAKILFTSPEAILKNIELHRLLDEAAKNNYLNNIVIDEAHVVPDWGVFFRPDFQIFSIVLKSWRKISNNYIRTFLLSATLSDEVVDTLFALFGSEGLNAQIRCDELRKEPRFYFQSVKSLEEQDEKTLEAIRLLPKPMVVYVLEPREAKSLQIKLNQAGYLNIPVFTGETKDSEREIILTGWKKHLYDIVIATSAFGIGVDKPDVRTIIHACCPENLSRFYQEVGRAGRDRLPSISLFMPYQNRYDGEGDVRRALGLVNKRVLTVEKAVIRWESMINNPSSFVDGDICILDTSTVPLSMTDDEAEYAGNRNVAWNVNLLLFLHRIGFIELLEADYVINGYGKYIKKYYTIKVKLKAVEILGDSVKLAEALQKPRKNEYDSQMEGYRVISELVSSPKSNCWGRVFKHLFPLAREVCNGCPTDPYGRITTDDIYKLRVDPSITLSPAKLCRRLERNMGSFTQLVVKRSVNGPCTFEEIATLASKASENNIGVFVVPNRFASKIEFNGILMNYNEFYFSVKHCPYLFSKGVVCVFDGDAGTNYTLYKNLERLYDFNYTVVLYCNENISVTSNGKALRECMEGYSISIDKF